MPAVTRRAAADDDPPPSAEATLAPAKNAEARMAKVSERLGFLMTHQPPETAGRGTDMAIAAQQIAAVQVTGPVTEAQLSAWEAAVTPLKED